MFLQTFGHQHKVVGCTFNKNDLHHLSHSCRTECHTLILVFSAKFAFCSSLSELFFCMMSFSEQNTGQATTLWVFAPHLRIFTLLVKLIPLVPNRVERSLIAKVIIFISSNNFSGSNRTRNIVSNKNYVLSWIVNKCFNYLLFLI